MRKKINEINENVICECKPHWISFALPLLASVLILMFLLLIIILVPKTVTVFTVIFFVITSILSFIIPYFTIKSNHLILTDKRIYGKYGIVKTSSMSAPISKIQTFNINTNFLGKILGYSDIIINCISGVYYFKKQKNAQDMQTEFWDMIKQ